MNVLCKLHVCGRYQKKKKIEEKTLFLMQSIGKVFLEYPGFYFS